MRAPSSTGESKYILLFHGICHSSLPFRRTLKGGACCQGSKTAYILYMATKNKFYLQAIQGFGRDFVFKGDYCVQSAYVPAYQ